MKLAVVTERSVALVLTCLENIIHGGVIFGWPSLVFILIQLGYFSHLCDQNTENSEKSSLNINQSSTGDGTIINVNRSAHLSNISCHEQESELQLVYSLAVAFQTIAMFPVGFFFDRFGTRLSKILASFLLLVGYLMTGLSSPTNPLLLFPGTIAFAMAGSMILFSSMQIGNIFQGMKSTVIAVINGMFASSTIVFLVAKVAYEAGLSIQIFFAIMAGSLIVIHINTFIFLPVKHIPWPYPENHRLIKSCRTSNTHLNQADVDGLRNEGFVVDTSDDRCPKEHPRRIEGTVGVECVEVTDGINPVTDGEQVTSQEEQSKSTDGSFEDKKNKKYPRFLSCVLSSPFGMILLWQSTLQLHLYFVLGTTNYFLTRLTNYDQSLVSRYTDIFGIIQTMGFFTGSLGGFLIDRNKLTIPCFSKKKPKVRREFADMRDSCLPLVATSLSAIGYSVCLLIPSLHVQYFTFIFILMERSLLFGVGASVTAIVFPMKYFASVYGAIRTIGGFVSFIQYPIFTLIQKYLSDDPFWVMIAFIVADCVTLILPIALYVMSKEKSKDPDVALESASTNAWSTN